MSEGYRAFAFKSWEGKGSDQTLLPDDVLEPLYEGLEASRLPLEFRFIRAQHNAAIARERWSQEQVINLTRSVWYHLGGISLQKIFDFELARHPLKFTPDDDAPHMTSGGRCGLDGIEFRFDGTLSDPVYMAHESGHLVQQRLGYGPKSVAELPAFFAQEAGYHVLGNVMNDRGNAARIHRLGEFLRIQDSRDRAMALLKKDAPADWKEDRMVGALHMHCAAMPLMMALYKPFCVMKPEDKKKVLHALYHDKDITFKRVMNAFGMYTSNDFLTAGTYAGNLMRNEAIELGFLPTPVYAASVKPAF